MRHIEIREGKEMAAGYLIYCEEFGDATPWEQLTYDSILKNRQVIPGVNVLVHSVTVRSKQRSLQCLSCTHANKLS